LCTPQIGLWVSLFVLSTLLINAPSIPAVLRFTGLAQARNSAGKALAPLSAEGTEWKMALMCNANLVAKCITSLQMRQVSPVKLSIREKAKRALLRYTAGAIQARRSSCAPPSRTDIDTVGAAQCHFWAAHPLLQC
jgi:hypothetical protein